MEGNVGAGVRGTWGTQRGKHGLGEGLNDLPLPSITILVLIECGWQRIGENTPVDQI